MSGIINASKAAAPSDRLGNPLLAEAEAKVEGNIVDPQVRADYGKIVVAGLHIALAKGVEGFAAKLRDSQDPIGDCAKGAAALVMIMRKEARGVMSMKAGVPAGMTLMLHGLDLIDSAGIAKIAEPELDRATAVFTNELFHRLGITAQMLQHMTGRVHQIMQDPGMMQKINLKAGVTRHALADTPTPLPDAG